MQELAREQQQRMEEVTGRGPLAALVPQWEALADDVAPGVPFVRPAFIFGWCRAFAPSLPLRVVCVRSEDGRLEALLPLLAQREWLYGLPVRGLNAPVNAHSCRFDLLARDPWISGPKLLEHLEEKGGWDRLLLRDVPEKGAGEVLFELARRRGLPVGRWESQRSPWFALPDDVAALQETLDTKFKSNLRRRRRKLAQDGALSLERFEGGPQLFERLEEGFALERSGWKGKRGTAIAQDAATRQFYEELAERSVREGTLALYFLRQEGRAVAFQFGLQQGARYFLLKPAYDESLGACSPGQLLMEDVTADLIGRGVREFDFLGPDMTWKRDWADRVRVHTWYSIHARGRLGTLLHAAKFRVSPAVKEVLGPWLH